MKNAMISAGVSVFVLAIAGVANAQQIAPQCAAQAASAGIATTHDVVYNAADNTCVATPALAGTVSSQGQVVAGLGALSAPVVVGGTLALVATIAVVGDLGSSGGTN
jgi:hypothetical protein